MAMSAMRTLCFRATPLASPRIVCCPRAYPACGFRDVLHLRVGPQAETAECFLDQYEVVKHNSFDEVASTSGTRHE